MQPGNISKNLIFFFSIRNSGVVQEHPGIYEMFLKMPIMILVGSL